MKMLVRRLLFLQGERQSELKTDPKCSSVFIILESTTWPELQFEKKGYKLWQIKLQQTCLCIDISLDSLLTKQIFLSFKLSVRKNDFWSYTRFCWHRMIYDLFLLNFKSVVLSLLLKVIPYFHLSSYLYPFTCFFWSAFKDSKI